MTMKKFTQTTLFTSTNNAETATIGLVTKSSTIITIHICITTMTTYSTAIVNYIFISNNIINNDVLSTKITVSTKTIIITSVM